MFCKLIGVPRKQYNKLGTVNSNLVPLNDAATPTAPQRRPRKKAATVTGVEISCHLNCRSVRPSDVNTHPRATLKVPTNAAKPKARKIGTAGNHFDPSTSRITGRASISRNQTMGIPTKVMAPMAW